MRCVLGLSVVAAATAVAGAQTTWIVDCQNGPGTNFLDIPAAVAAASDGDRIVIRGRGTGPANDYTAPTVDGKGLTFVREGSLPAQVVLPWNIRNLAPNQTVVLSDLQLGRPGGVSGLVASNNHGLVVLDRAVAEFNWGSSVCTDCDLVIVTRSDIWASYYDPIVVSRSRLVIHDTQMRGFQWIVGPGGGGPLQIGDSTAWLVNSYFEGVSGTVSYPNFISSAISVGRSDLFLGANTTIYGGYSYSVGLRAWGITDWGTVAAPSSRVHYDPNDPSVVMDAFPGFQLTYGPVSSLALAQTATDLTLTQRAVPMSLTLLVAGGLTTTPWSSVMGPAFIDPNDVRFVELRIAPSTGAVTRGFTIPPGLPQGFRLAFQGAGLSPANVLSTTNPVLYGVW